ncbi:hypothetical protein [Paludisphaera sp.]|uniref:hypothetical protein n=1 Tax=Paludisphaera sp. TaxID=2017432 RepID=UPI00301E3470
MIPFLLRLLMWALTILSGPYRVLSEPYDKFGGFVYGTLTFFGLTVIYPYVNAELHGLGMWPPFIWFGQLILAYVYAFARWFSLKPPADPGTRNSWAGRNEPLFAIALVFACFGLRSPGTGLLLLSGFIASQVQVELVNLIRRLEGWTPEDGEKVKEAAVARAKRLRGLATAAIMSIRRKPEVVDVPRAPQPVASGLLDQLYPPPYGGHYPPHLYQQPSAAQKPLTLKDRVVSGLISHFLFWLVIGPLGFGGICAILLFLISIPIWLLGGVVHFPEWAKVRAPAFVVRMIDSIQDKKEAIGEKFDSLKGRFHDEEPEEPPVWVAPPIAPAAYTPRVAPPAPAFDPPPPPIQPDYPRSNSSVVIPDQPYETPAERAEKDRKASAATQKARDEKRFLEALGVLAEGAKGP